MLTLDAQTYDTLVLVNQQQTLAGGQIVNDRRMEMLEQIYGEEVNNGDIYAGVVEDVPWPVIFVTTVQGLLLMTFEGFSFA